jgi:hypothetical protein
MRKFLLIAAAAVAAVLFSPLAAAQPTGSRNGDAGASTEPSSPADASITKEPVKRPAREAGAGGTAPQKKDKQSKKAKPPKKKPQ